MQSKGRASKDNVVVLTPKALSPITAYLEKRGNIDELDPLFASVSSRNAGERLTVRSVSRIAKSALRAIGSTTSVTPPIPYAILRSRFRCSEVRRSATPSRWRGTPISPPRCCIPTISIESSMPLSARSAMFLTSRIPLSASAVSIFRRGKHLQPLEGSCGPPARKRAEWLPCIFPERMLAETSRR